MIPTSPRLHVSPTHPAMLRTLPCPGSRQSQNHFLGKTKRSGQCRGAAGIVPQLPMNQGLLSPGWAEAATSARRTQGLYGYGASEKTLQLAPEQIWRHSPASQTLPKERQIQPKIYPTGGKDAFPEPFSCAVLSFPRQQKQKCL